MYTAATINQFQPEGWPRKFLLQFCSVLTSNFDRFFIISKLFEYYGKNWQFYVLRNSFFSCVLFQSVWNLMACVKVLVEVYTTCGCNTIFPCAVDIIMDGFGIVENTAFNNVYTCIAPQRTFWTQISFQIYWWIVVDLNPCRFLQIVQNSKKWLTPPLIGPSSM